MSNSVSYVRLHNYIPDENQDQHYASVSFCLFLISGFWKVVVRVIKQFW